MVDRVRTMEGVALNHWAGRSVMLTGQTGFKGAWLSYWLWRLGARVTGFGLSPRSEPSLFDLLRISQKVESLEGDVTDIAAARKVAQWADPSVIFHLAAQAEVLAAYADPVEAFRTNVLGTVHILEIGRSLPNLKAIVVVTSDKCYRNDKRLTAYGESDPLGGADPYSASKACAEMAADAFSGSYFEALACNVATARSGNVIGGGDWSRYRLVPDIVRSLTSGSDLRLRNPGATRPWQHVLEPLYGYLRLAEHLCADGTLAGPWNFGPVEGTPVSVAHLARSFSEAWGERLSWRLGESTLQEPQRLCLAVDKAKTRLGWSTLLSYQEAIQWTASWYRAWHLGESAERLTSQQIEAYEALAFAS